jgi:hypothetical protein
MEVDREARLPLMVMTREKSNSVTNVGEPTG